MSDNTWFRPFSHMLLCTLFGVIFFMTPAVAADKVETNLEKAIKSGQREILFSGKEKDDITIKKGVAVTGVSLDQATIVGDIKMEDGASLANVTVTGKRTVITVEKGANVTLSNVTVRGGGEVGILTKEGGGTLTVRNSRITKNQKGFYILPGKNINLSGNVITENKEEGLDVRAGTSGSIIGNQFLNNGEGGAEIIAGSARLTIKQNTFAGNKSSGLALQAYSGTGKAPGSVSVSDNTFSGNGNFGLVCSSPSKGGAGGLFFQRVIRLTDNTFQNNKAGNIDPVCAVGNHQSASLSTTTHQGVMNREQERAQRKVLQREMAEYFETTSTLLHDREHQLEERLRTYEAGVTWWQWLTQPAIAPETAENINHDIAEINTLREALIHFPEEWLDPAMTARREAVVTRSLERMEELRQYFERLQHPLF